MLQAMYRHDFSEPEFVGTSTMFECSEVPREYRKFTRIVERGTSKKCEYYGVLKSFLDPNLKLSDSKKQVIQKMMDLKEDL